MGQYEAAACRNASLSDPTCLEIQNNMSSLTSGLDGYALDFPVCTTASGGQRHAEVAEAAAMLKAAGGYFPDYQPCADSWGGKYLSRADVQAAIHAKTPPGGVWQECSNTVGSRYSVSDVNAPMMPVYDYLLSHSPHLNILVYSGDDDSVCAPLGTQQWIWGVGGTITSPWAAWKVDDQVAGFTVGFERNFRWATVHGAGHMVPATRPAQALQLFTKYLSGEW